MGPKDSQPFITGELQDMVATVGESFLRKVPQSVIKAPENEELRFTASAAGLGLPAPCPSFSCGATERGLASFRPRGHDLLRNANGAVV